MSLINKIKRKTKKKIIRFFFIYPRILKFRLLSDIERVKGSPYRIQPVLLTGKGKIFFGKNVRLGYDPSPYLFSGYIHMEARTEQAKINVGDNVSINNNFTAISEGAEIIIGDDCLIGTEVSIYDSDFHELTPAFRSRGSHIKQSVNIEKNVFIGSNVKILKGVTIGENSVIANGSIVTKSIPKNVIAGGYPCKVIRDL